MLALALAAALLVWLGGSADAGPQPQVEIAGDIDLDPGAEPEDGPEQEDDDFARGPGRDAALPLTGRAIAAAPPSDDARLGFPSGVFRPPDA